jgi:hypothetical protein
MAQWRSAASALERVKMEELQGMTEADAAEIVNHVLPEPEYANHGTPSDPLTGLVEQQKIFQRARSKM